ncbi:hypothetical protein CERZMDRAFT_88910 [Cercospora zeae-maydis SCOH1-5]|uniref:Extracellular membrane protein CFEM domain-containing protein n=1 Tax=Cercospora zeae-maydis SCOH1-5 TaxID=717836 RepID=A0A6A6F304_9PEZI|nr:hypothetical protein CERZMDRAFT_88910 [Cercospora zeae-maydis SCOH1-5]
MHTFTIIATALAIAAAANDAPTEKSCEKQCNETFINPKPCLLKFCKSAHPPLAVRDSSPATVTVIETLVYHETICPTTPQQSAISTALQPALQSTPTGDTSVSVKPPASPIYHTSGTPPAKTSPSVESTWSQPEQHQESSKSTEVPVESSTTPSLPSSRSSSSERQSPTESPSNADQTPNFTTAEEHPQQSGPIPAAGGASAYGASFGVVILGIVAMM